MGNHKFIRTTLHPPVRMEYEEFERSNELSQSLNASRNDLMRLGLLLVNQLESTGQLKKGEVQPLIKKLHIKF